MVRSTLATAIALSVLGLVACRGERTRLPPPPPPPADAGSVRPPPPITGSDAGTDAGPGDGGLPDGASADAAMPAGCAVVAPGDPNNNIELVGLDIAAELTPNRVWSEWDRARCSAPTLLVGLSPNGECAPGVAGGLVLGILRSSTADLLAGNPYPITAFDNRLTIRLTIPTDTGDQTWGNCSDASGGIRFAALDPSVGGEVKATFDMTLTDCDLTPQNAPINVTGAIDAFVAEPFPSPCP